MSINVQVTVAPRYYVYRRYTTKMISREDLMSFVDHLIVNDPRTVVGVRSKGSRFVYDALSSAKELRLDFDSTILPPKKFFLPRCETLSEYDLGKDWEVRPVIESEPLIILGVHPYDLIAIEQMDEVFKEGNADAHYLKRRKDSILVGVNMVNVSPHSFAASLGTATTVHGFDIMLTALGGRFAIEVGSDAGEDLIKDCKGVLEADDRALGELDRVKKAITSGFERHLHFSYEELPALLNANYDSPLWEKNAEKCLGCGACNLVCPTCYCFDVVDQVQLDLKKASRQRRWDGCLLEDFAKVAGGENFRKPAERYRHRFMRKGKYIFDRFGFIGCVGCGRCASNCLADVADPVKVYNRLKEGFE